VAGKTEGQNRSSFLEDMTKTVCLFFLRKKKKQKKKKKKKQFGFFSEARCINLY